MMWRFAVPLILIVLLVPFLSALSEPADPTQSLLEGIAGQPAPFEAGEKLVYEVNWKPLIIIPAFKAGEITISIETSMREGIDTYKLRGWAVSGGALARIAGMEIRNYYESEIDRKEYRSYGILQQTRESSKERDLNLVFDYARDVTLVDEVDPAVNPPRQVKSLRKAGIPGPVVDVLSVFYVTRILPIDRGDDYFFDLNTRGDFERVALHGDEVETVSTEVGKFKARRLTTVGGLFSGGGDFRLWLAAAPSRIPVKFEADVKLGKVYGKLIRMESPRITRSRIRTQ